MARPRTFVNRQGRPVKHDTGVGLHKSTGKFYIIIGAKERRYFGDWDAARAALAMAEVVHEPGIRMELPDHDLFAGPDPDELPPLGTPLDDLPDDYPHREWLQDRAAGAPITKLVDVPSADLWRWAADEYIRDPELFLRRIGHGEPESVKGEGPTLKLIGEKWREVQLVKHGDETRHTGEMLTRWHKFTKAVGGARRRVDTLTPADFRAFHAAVAKQTRGKSGKTFNDLCSTPKCIIDRVRRRYPDLDIPAELVLWAGSYDAKPYKPARSNRQPITPEEFSALITQCGAWAKTNPEDYDASTQSGRAKRLQAGHRRRTGAMMEAALRLALNCALDAVDVERIEWENLKLDGSLPYMDFPRRKTEHRTGEATPRCTPLMPATVAALKAWQAYEGHKSGPVFRSTVKGTLDRKRTAHAFNRLRDAAGINGGLTFKHLRNAAPSIAYRKLRSRDLADMILGHQIGSEASKYVGDADDPAVLIDLVQELGKIYQA